MTRRKNMCHITDDQDEPIWSGIGVGQALIHLREHDQKSFKLQGPAEDQAFTLTFRQV